MPTLKSTSDAIRQINVIAGALLASVVVYMVIALIVTREMTQSEADAQLVQTLAAVLALLSLGNLLAAHVVFTNRMAAARKLATPDQRLAFYRVFFIVASALRETVAVFGLILSFLSGDPQWCLGFGSIALIAMLLGWPKRSQMEKLASEIPPID